MTTGESVTQQKRAAARAAVAEIADGMVVGLGTGSTAALALEAMAALASSGIRVRGVATSRATGDAARALGIALIDLAERPGVDLAIDGVDEIDRRLRAIKGAGGAMLREKIVGDAAGRMIAIADAAKPVERLGRRPVPVEALPFGVAAVARGLEALGAAVTRRRDGDGGWVATDQGNAILDCAFGAIDDPERLAAGIDALPGALGHGLFVTEIDALYVGRPGGGVERFERTATPHLSEEQARP